MGSLYQLTCTWAVFALKLRAKAPEKVKPAPKNESSFSNFQALVLQLWISGVRYNSIILAFF